MLNKLNIPPGVIREVTQYAAEDIGWFDTDKVRFRKGYPEKIGGWQKYFANQLDGVPRSFHVWRLLDGRVAIAIGTEEKVYLYLDNTLIDITPIRHIATPLGTDPLSVVYNDDVDASYVTVHHTNHHFGVGDDVTIYSAQGFGGLSAGALNREFTIVAPVTTDSYTIKMRPPEDGDGDPIPDLDAEVADEAWEVGGGDAATITLDVNGQDETRSLLPDSFKLLAGISSGNTTYTYNTRMISPNHGLEANDTFTLAGVEGFFGVPDANFNGVRTVVERISAHEIGFDVATTPDELYGGGELVEASGPTYLNDPPFTTVFNTHEVLVSHTGHGATAGATVSFGGAVAVGGIPAVQLNTSHIITRVDSANTYAIDVTSLATSSTTGGGGSVTAVYQLNPADVNAAGKLWSFDSWGEDLIINEWGGSVYRWDASNENDHATIIASAPRISQLIKVTDSRHLVCYGCSQANDRDSELDTLHIQWCSQEDLDDWDITSEYNSAGDFLLTGGSQILAAAKVEGQVLIWTEESVHGMLNIGPPLTFQFDQVGTSTGIIGPNAWATHDGITLWMGDAAFYAYHGGVVSVVCSVQDFVFSAVDFDYRRRAFAAVDRRNDEVTWYYPTEAVEDTSLAVDILAGISSILVASTAGYPSSGSLTIGGDTVVYTSKTDTMFHGCTGVTVDAAAETAVSLVGADGSNEPCRYVTFSTKDNLWWIGRLERTAWIDRGAIAHPIAANAEGHIYEHEVTADSNGEALPACAESAEFDLGDGNEIIFINRFVPDFDFRGVSGSSLEVSLRTRYWPHSSPQVAELIGTISASIPKLDTRIRGRQMSIKLRSFDLGDEWRMGACRVDLQPDGGKN